MSWPWLYLPHFSSLASLWEPALLCAQKHPKIRFDVTLAIPKTFPPLFSPSPAAFRNDDIMGLESRIEPKGSL